jgi:hypothetical protein
MAGAQDGLSLHAKRACLPVMLSTYFLTYFLTCTLRKKAGADRCVAAKVLSRSHAVFAAPCVAGVVLAPVTISCVEERQTPC